MKTRYLDVPVQAVVSIADLFLQQIQKLSALLLSLAEARHGMID
jgi:hypothetical protein